MAIMLHGQENNENDLQMQPPVWSVTTGDVGNIK